MVKLVQMRVRVSPNGDAIVPLGRESAGTTVDVTVTPIDEPDFINGIPRAKWFAMLEETAGSIDDPTFVRPPQPIYEHPLPID